ncbi:MAG: hypothetical protein E6I30_12555 [Chloroflexi bacterium]|nr:MAG: hypothetical protein E6I30_12555 [Chloroflexota bacterium]
MPPYIGRRMRRVEDERLITGRGRFAGDIKLEGLVHIAFCRSGLPHAHIGAIDTSAAKAMPGVIAVWTAHDLPKTADGLSDWGPDDMVARGRPILNRDEVNYVGDRGHRNRCAESARRYGRQHRTQEDAGLRRHQSSVWARQRDRPDPPDHLPRRRRGDGTARGHRGAGSGNRRS